MYIHRYSSTAAVVLCCCSTHVQQAAGEYDTRRSVLQAQLPRQNDHLKSLGHVKYSAAEALPGMLTARVPVNGLCQDDALAASEQEFNQHWSCTHKKRGNKYGVTNRKIRGKFGRNFDAPRSRRSRRAWGAGAGTRDHAVRSREGEGRRRGTLKQA